ncbi:MazG nucleotide pyrophosphohydrolase domain-containing protein [Pseudoneobacillus sp. C159]
MKKLQDFAEKFQQEMNWEISNENYQMSRSSLLNNYMLLTTEVAELAEELRKAFNQTHKLVEDGMDENEAFQLSKGQIKEDLGKEMADCLAYICKIANFFDIDLEQSFYSKVAEVKQRKNKDIRMIPNK